MLKEQSSGMNHGGTIFSYLLIDKRRKISVYVILLLGLEKQNKFSWKHLNKIIRYKYKRKGVFLFSNFFQNQNQTATYFKYFCISI